MTSELHRVLHRIDRDTGHDATAGNVLVLRVFGPVSFATIPERSHSTSANAILPLMDTIPFPPTSNARPESEAARERRIAYEAVLLEDARASAAAGRTVSAEAVSAWIASLDTDHELPVPRPGC